MVAFLDEDDRLVDDPLTMSDDGRSGRASVRPDAVDALMHGRESPPRPSLPTPTQSEPDEEAAAGRFACIVDKGATTERSRYTDDGTVRRASAFAWRPTRARSLDEHHTGASALAENVRSDRPGPGVRLRRSEEAFAWIGNGIPPQRMRTWSDEGASRRSSMLRQDSTAETISEYDDVIRLRTNLDFELPSQYLVLGEDDDDAGTSSFGPLSVATPSVLPKIDEFAVVRSEYMKSELGGVHQGKVRITIYPGQSEECEAIWNHVNQPLKSIDELVLIANAVCPLTDIGRRIVGNFVRRIQSEHENHRSDGADLDPVCVSLNDDSTDVSKQRPSAVFMSFPFFQASKMRSQQHQRGRHPSRTLLQSQYFGTTEKRDRQQVLAQNSSKAGNACLYVSQLWVLLVNNTTLITYTNLAHGDLLSSPFIELPPPTTDAKMRRGQIQPYVSIVDYRDRRWNLPIERCIKWPNLWANLVERFSHSSWCYSLIRNGKTLAATDWASVVKESENGVIDLRLVEEESGAGTQQYRQLKDELTTFFFEDAELDEQGDADSEGSTTSVPSESAISSNARRSVYQQPLLKIFEHADNGKNALTLRSIADDLHHTLSHHKSRWGRQPYLRRGQSSVQSLDALLAKIYRDRRRHSDYGDFSRYSTDLAVLSKHLYSFFWPWDFQHPMLGKYWAAIEEILISYEPSTLGSHGLQFSADNATDLQPVVEFLRDALARVIAITGVYEHDLDAVPALPHQIFRAWLLLLMGLILLAQYRRAQHSPVEAFNAALEHFENMCTALKESDQVLVQRTRTLRIEDHEGCQPTGIVAIMLDRLRRLDTHDQRDLRTIYAEFLARLDDKITQNPLLRSHEQSLRFYIQEANAICEVLLQQKAVFAQLSDLRDCQKQLVLEYSHVGGEEPRDTTIQRCLSSIDARIDAFKHLIRRAEDLETLVHAHMVDSKDQQEGAIYLFTVVTVIFLPISSIASVFGMNTYDIRNTDLGQWVFWVISVPVTITVVVGSMWWVGKLDASSILDALRPRKPAGRMKIPALEKHDLPVYVTVT